MMKTDNVSLTYEENQRLETEIQKILDSPVSLKHKAAQLRKLQEQCQTSAGKNHAAYYIERLRRQAKTRYKHIICVLVIGIWLCYIAYRTYLFLHPEQYAIVSLLGATPLQSAYAILLLPVAILIYYVILYLISFR